MTGYAEIAVALLAAGQGSRFGSDKLLVEIGGEPMGLRPATSSGDLGFGWRFAVCRADSDLAARYEDLGFRPIFNTRPGGGQAQSLHLAVEAAMATDAKALLLMLADMPFVTAHHISSLIGAYSGQIVASSDGNAHMPPVIFPRESWPKLLETSGDAGARGLLRNAQVVEAPAAELRDVDYLADLPASK